jgi:hypothetical protein
MVRGTADAVRMMVEAANREARRTMIQEFLK